MNKPSNRTIIVPQSGLRMLDLGEMWSYRRLFWVLTLRDIKVRYKQTVLGFAWAIVQPVTMMLVFSILFGRLAGIPSDGFPYPVFVYAGLLPWFFFSNSIATCGNSIISSVALISKVYFPRVIIPISAVGAGLVEFAISMGVLLLVMAYYGVAWTINLVAVPFLTLALIFTVLGIGMLLAALTAIYRDFRYATPFLVQLWMFATPVVYSVTLVPEQWRWVLYLNPVTGVVTGFRSAFLGIAFDWPALGISLLVASVLFLAGVTYFAKAESHLVDVV